MNRVSTDSFSPWISKTRVFLLRSVQPDEFPRPRRDLSLSNLSDRRIGSLLFRDSPSSLGNLLRPDDNSSFRTRYTG